MAPSWRMPSGHCWDNGRSLMALDHYVPQVHLRNFYAPDLGGRLMHAIRKADLEQFPTRSRDVCRIEAGSTNAYLTRSRAVEEFLKEIEPRYNTSVDKLRGNSMDRHAIASIAGFVAYIITCSPTAMRIESGPLKAALEAAAKSLDAEGQVPQAPDALGNKSLTDLLSDGSVSFKVDPKYPQAIGIANIVRHTSTLGNSPWEVLHNDRTDAAFFTSDFPAAIEVTGDQSPINRIVPLAPNLAIRIKPDIRLAGKPPNLSFPGFKAVQRKLSRAEVVEINRLIVRCAEDVLFYRDEREWVKPLVTKNRNYRIEPVTFTAGGVLFATQRITRRSS